MRVKLTAPATADLRGIEHYISQDNVAAAEKVVHQLKASCFLLAEHPGIGRRRDYIKPKLRTVTEGSYLICYRVKRSSIEVLRILHSSRDIEKILSRNA